MAAWNSALGTLQQGADAACQTANFDLDWDYWSNGKLVLHRTWDGDLHLPLTSLRHDVMTPAAPVIHEPVADHGSSMGFPCGQCSVPREDEPAYDHRRHGTYDRQLKERRSLRLGGDGRWLRRRVHDQL